MSIFPTAKTPATALGYYRVLSPLSGLRVSPLCLGGMSIGDAWGGVMGSMPKDQAFKLLDAYYEAGGNFIDTANSYQDDQSEEWIGEWIEKRGIRDQLVVATKYTTSYEQYKLKDTPHGIAANYGGNHTKSLHLSVRDSLKKLRTDYIDILYLHWWDYTTSVEEVMRSLDNMVKTGKALYLGISDTPAWIVAKANQFAKDNNLTPFSVYQGHWSVMVRDFERDIIPMCLQDGLAIVPWGTMGQGKFQSKAQIEARKKNNEGLRSAFNPNQTEQEAKVSAALEKVALEIGATITAVALAYCLQRCPHVFPIIGGRKVEHLNDNIKALEITLTEEQVKYLESQSSYDPGFPVGMIGEDPHRSGETQMFFVKNYAHIKWVKQSSAIAGTKN